MIQQAAAGVFNGVAKLLLARFFAETMNSELMHQTLLQ
jgi:hypothetical protein